MKILSTNWRSKGFSLIEVLMGMAAFAVIFTGLASTFQAVMIANRATLGLSECIRQYNDGMRLLLEGDPGHQYPHNGLLVAEMAQLCPSFTHPNPIYGTVDGALAYQVDNASYIVWIADGKLLRMPGILPLPEPRVLMGSGSAIIPRNRVMMTNTTTAAAPIATFTFNWLATTTPTLVRLTINLHGDVDGDALVSPAEATLRMQPTVYLRNAK